MKEYEVTIKLEVTADNESEALMNAAMDIAELNKDGTLEADIKELPENR